MMIVNQDDENGGAVKKASKVQQRASKNAANKKSLSKTHTSQPSGILKNRSSSPTSLRVDNLAPSTKDIDRIQNLNNSIDIEMGEKDKKPNQKRRLHSKYASARPTQPNSFRT